MGWISYNTGLKVYEAIPTGLRYLMESMMRPIPRHVLLGKGFQDKLNFLMRSDKWSIEEIEEYQFKRLMALLRHADKNVPFYHNLFKSEGIQISDLTNIGSLRRVPILTKECVRNQFNDMKALNWAEYSPGEAHTTGSTGRPLHFLLDQQNREIEYASVWRHLCWGGMKGVDARIATFRGDFVSEREKQSRLWRWDGRLGELTFNTYNLNHENIRRMIARLNRFKPEVIRAYPHSLYIVSKGLNQSKLSLDFIPKCIQTSSEQLTSVMRENIEGTFGTKILDWYGQSEYVISAGECEEGHYHQVMETGIMNIQEDAWGVEKLIGTGLWNYSMPLINYDIGDNFLWDDGECGCGRKHHALRSIEGRLNDIILTSDGRGLSGVGIDNYYEKEVIPLLKNVPDYFKIIQEDMSKFSIEVFKEDGVLDKDVVTIKEAFINLLGKDVVISMKRLDDFPQLRKWKNVESRLSSDTVAKALGASIE